MTTGLRELPTAAWARVLISTAIFVLGGTLVSVLAGQLIMESYGEGLSGAGLIVSIVLPILIGTPLTLLHLIRVAQLRLANDKLLVLASTDWLTGCLNRRAFAKRVDSQLATRGAFLVIDADHFKVINDRFGHDRGDEALQLLASIIKSSVRADDFVGRMGGEEFGVFLQDADQATTQVVAERIRGAIANARFAPGGIRVPLSVSVGGASFDGAISFAELFRIADQRLYGVKQSGRNRADVVSATVDGGEPMDEPALAAQ